MAQAKCLDDSAHFFTVDVDADVDDEMTRCDEMLICRDDSTLFFNTFSTLNMSDFEHVGSTKFLPQA